MVRLAYRLLQRKVPEYWKRHLDRAMNLSAKPARYVPLRGWVGEDKRLNWMYTQDKPSTMENQIENRKTHHEVELIEPIEEWTIQRGDRVEILVGRDKGKHGIVRDIVYQRNWVFVEDLNLQYTFRKEIGQLIAQEMPLDVSSEVALVDPRTGKAATKAEWRYTETGKKIRVLFPSGVILTPEKMFEELADGVCPQTYIANPQTDTTEKQLERTTYEANLKTFEEDVMDNMDIVETRTRGKTYWY
ncbi:large ribosomal subunit protein uL24m-like [Watersipora subatra]|uniref:large ribosomal subunit protein uL24m-like n=1 Tax=Watersipora subatra TaxID=2589382 RepID=UPI00355B7853